MQSGMDKADRNLLKKMIFYFIPATTIYKIP